MSLWDDVKAIPIIDIANDLDIQIVSEKPSYAMAVCPFHEDHVGAGGKPNLSLIKTLNRFKCHVCGEKGSVIDLWAKATKVDAVTALKAIAAKYNLTDPQAGSYAHQGAPAGSKGKKSASKPSGVKQGTKKSPMKSTLYWTAEKAQKSHEAFLEPVNQDHLESFLEKRGLTKEYIIEKKIGLEILSGKMGPSYTIPVYTKAGKLLAVRFHSAVLKGQKIYAKGSNAKALYDQKSFDPDAPEIWIVEGEGDLWTLESRGKNVLTSMSGAASMKNTWADNLGLFDPDAKAAVEKIKAKDRIVLVPDNDAPGLRAMAEIRTRMPKDAKVFRVFWPEDFPHKGDVSDWFLKWKRSDHEFETCVQPYGYDEASTFLNQLEAAKKIAQESGNPVYVHANCYFKMRKTTTGGTGAAFDDSERVSSFVIHGKAIIKVEREAYTRADIVCVDGSKEIDVILPPETWRSKQRFLEQFPDTKYKFTGSDKDVQNIMELVRKMVPVNQIKKGIKRIGFTDDCFTGPGFAITKKGLDEEAGMEYVPTGVPLESFMKLVQAKGNPKGIMGEFAKVILKINQPQVVIPTMGWMFSCFFKEQVQKTLDYFPILAIFGTSGSGKTSMIRSLLRIFSLTEGTRIFNAGATAFTAMRMLSCTNCVPIAIDELKADVGRDKINFWKSHLRSAYFGETETRGRKDLSIAEYPYQAPLIVMGEMSIVREQAVAERTVAVRPERFNITSAEGKGARDAFYKLNKQIAIEELFVPIVTWVLNHGSEDFYAEWTQARAELKAMKLPHLDDRVWGNYVTTIFGINQLERFAKHLGVNFEVPTDLRRRAMGTLVEEILTVGQRTKMGFDEFIECLASMASTEIIKNENHYHLDGGWLYIHLSSVIPLFRKWARDTQWDGEIFGRKEYLNQAKELIKMKYSYVHELFKVKRFANKTHRCVMLNLRRATKLGLDVSGFTSFEEEDFNVPPPVDTDPVPTESEEGTEKDPLEEAASGGGDDGWGEVFDEE